MQGNQAITIAQQRTPASQFHYLTPIAARTGTPPYAHTTSMQNNKSTVVHASGNANDTPQDDGRATVATGVGATERIDKMDEADRRELMEYRRLHRKGGGVSSSLANPAQGSGPPEQVTPDTKQTGSTNREGRMEVKMGTPSQAAFDLIAKSANLSLLKQAEYLSPHGIEVLIAIIAARVELRNNVVLSDQERKKLTASAYCASFQTLYRLASMPVQANSFYEKAMKSPMILFSPSEARPCDQPHITPNMGTGMQAGVDTLKAGELRVSLRTWAARFYPGKARVIKDRLAKTGVEKLRQLASVPGAYGKWIQNLGVGLDYVIPTAIAINRETAIQIFKPGTLDQTVSVRVHNIPVNTPVLTSVPEVVYHDGKRTANSDTFENILLGGDFLIGNTLSPSPVMSVEIERDPQQESNTLIVRGKDRGAMTLFAHKLIDLLCDYVKGLQADTLRLDTTGLSTRGNGRSSLPHIHNMGITTKQFENMTMDDRKLFVQANIPQALMGRVPSSSFGNAIEHIVAMSAQSVSDLVLDQHKYNDFVAGLGGEQKKWKWGEGPHGSNVEHTIHL